MQRPNSTFKGKTLQGRYYRHYQHKNFLASFGLDFDPFIQPIAEREMLGEGNSQPFFSYFVPSDILFTPNNQPDSNRLSADNMLIYGKQGSGKTSLRFILEAHHRATNNQTLVISYVANQTTAATNFATYQRQVVQALTVDLLVQIIEKFNLKSNKLNQRSIESLRSLVSNGTESLIYFLKDLNKNSATINDIRTHLHRVNKFSTQFIPPSKQIFEFIDAILAPNLNNNDLSLISGAQVVKELGYERISILFDMPEFIDFTTFDICHWTDLALQTASYFATSVNILPVDVKLFLPWEKRDALRHTVATIPVMKLPLVEAEIKWEDHQLRHLLAQRFRAAGVRYDGPSGIADQSIELDLDDWVIQAAQRSPRRLLEVMRKLLDMHLTRRDKEQRLSEQTWKMVRERSVGYS